MSSKLTIAVKKEGEEPHRIRSFAGRKIYTAFSVREKLAMVDGKIDLNQREALEDCIRGIASNIGREHTVDSGMHTVRDLKYAIATIALREVGLRFRNTVGTYIDFFNVMFELPTTVPWVDYPYGGTNGFTAPLEQQVELFLTGQNIGIRLKILEKQSHQNDSTLHDEILVDVGGLGPETIDPTILDQQIIDDSIVALVFDGMASFWHENRVATGLIVPAIGYVEELKECARRIRGSKLKIPEGFEHTQQMILDAADLLLADATFQY